MRNAILLPAAFIAAISAAAMAAAAPAGWHTFHDPRGFSISYPADWSADPKFTDLDYPDENGDRAKIEGLAVGPDKDLQPNTTLQGKGVVVAVEVLPAFRMGCKAINFLAQQPPDYSGGVDIDTPEYAHMTGGDPGRWYSNDDYVYVISKKPCIAVHYFVPYQTPGGTNSVGVKPFDRKRLLALLDSVRKTIVVDKR